MKKIMLLLFGVLLVGCGKGEESYLNETRELAEKSFELAIASEEIGTGYLKVWRDTIYDDSVEIDGRSYTDFNLSLTAQKQQYDDDGKITDLHLQAKLLNDLYKELKDKKSKKHFEEFKSAKKFYLETVEFMELSENPIGSYTSYSEAFSEKRTEITSAYSSLKVELEIE